MKLESMRIIKNSQMLQVQDIKHEKEIMDQRHQEIAEIKK